MKDRKTDDRNTFRRAHRALQRERTALAHRLLWRAVADAAQRGLVVCPEAPTLDAALYELTCRCAAFGLGLDDDVRASIALSEAERV